MRPDSNSTNDPEEPPKPKPKPEGSGRGGKKKPTAVGSGGDGGSDKKKRRSGGGHEDRPKKRVHIGRILTVQELGHLLGVGVPDVIHYLVNELNTMLTVHQTVEVDTAKKIAIGMGYEVSDSTIHHSLSDGTTRTITKPINLYKLLQVDPQAEQGLIRQAYRYLAEKYHPDNKVTGDEEMFRAITDAWKLLSDYAQRAIYDESLIDEETL